MNSKGNNSVGSVTAEEKKVNRDICSFSDLSEFRRFSDLTEFSIPAASLSPGDSQPPSVPATPSAATRLTTEQPAMTSNVAQPSQSVPATQQRVASPNVASSIVKPSLPPASPNASAPAVVKQASDVVASSQTITPKAVASAPPASAPPQLMKPPQTTMPAANVVAHQPQRQSQQIGETDIPPGLEQLQHLDQVLVYQKVELVSIRDNDEKHVTPKLRFQIKSPTTGDQLFYAYEESGAFMNKCCGTERGFDIHVEDPKGCVVLQMKRYYKLCGGCCWFAHCCDLCAYNYDVESPPGKTIARVHQSGTWWLPYYDVSDPEGLPMYTIQGPCFRLPHCMGACSDLKFGIYTLHRVPQQVGTIQKQWSGLNDEVVRGIPMLATSTFSVTFPPEMDVKMKATMLCSLFFFDVMYFDEERKKMLDCWGNRIIPKDPNASKTQSTGTQPSAVTPTKPTGTQPSAVTPTKPTGIQPSAVTPTKPTGTQPSAVTPTKPTGTKPSVSVAPTKPTGTKL